MIDIQSETLIPLKDVPGWCQENIGNRVHLSTCHRWRIRGARGVKLETILAGGQRYTSHESLARFFARSTAAADGDSRYLDSPSLAESDVKKAESFLESEGI